MKDNELTKFSRRKLLAGMGAVGAAGAIGGSGTMALLSDDETSKGNAITAGKLDLKIGWYEWYNGEKLDCPMVHNNPGPIFDLGDVKPGDSGEASIMVHVSDNPAYLWMGGELSSNAENGLTEPEQAVDSSGGDPGEGNGELADEIEVQLWYDDDASRTFDSDEQEIASGTLREVLNALSAGVPLDANRSTSQRDCYQPATTQYIGLEWNLPKTVDNRVQGDSVGFALKFYAQQCRHNDGSTNPFDGS